MKKNRPVRLCLNFALFDLYLWEVKTTDRIVAWIIVAKVFLQFIKFDRYDSVPGNLINLLELDNIHSDEILC